MQILARKVLLLDSRPLILKAIIANVYQLSQDRFGKQVVQHVIECGTQDVVRDIVAELRRYFAALSMDKYASNVVMTLLVYDKNATQIIDDIITSPSFWRVRRHPYGIFVLQCAKEYSVGSVCETLNHQIYLQSDHLQSHRNGKNILPKKKEKSNHNTTGSGVVAEKERSQRSRARPKKLEDYVTSFDG